MRPLEESNRRAGLAGLISEVEMICAGIIEIDRLFNESQSQHLRVKIHRALGVVADECDVM